jgi:hypothetical protein
MGKKGQGSKGRWRKDGKKGDNLCAQYGMDPKTMAYLGKVTKPPKGSREKERRAARRPACRWYARTGGLKPRRSPDK